MAPEQHLLFFPFLLVTLLEKIDSLCYWSNKDLMLVTLLFYFFAPSALGMAVLEGESYSLSDYQGSMLPFPESRQVYPLASSYPLFLFYFSPLASFKAPSC